MIAQKAQNFSYDLKSRLTKGSSKMKRKIKILIAEDEAISALSMQRALTRSGYDVCEMVSTGEEAVERVKQEKPDLVIMDVILNGRVNGIEAAMEIRSRSDIPIVFITGYEEGKLIEQIKSITSSTYLIKPFTPKALNRRSLKPFKMKINKGDHRNFQKLRRQAENV